MTYVSQSAEGARFQIIANTRAKNLTFREASVNNCFDLKLCLKQTLVSSRTGLTMTAPKIKNNQSLTAVRFHSWKLWPRSISFTTILKTRIS